MRRLFLSAAIMAIVAGGPFQAHAGDREIAQQIIDRLKVHRDAGSLKDFTLDLKVDQGVVLLRGSVGKAEQKENVLAAAKGIEGITKVVDEIEVRGAAKSNFSLKEALVAEAPKAGVAAAPIATAAPSLLPEAPAGEVGPVTLASEVKPAPEAGAPVAAEAPAIFPAPMVFPAGEIGPGMLTSDVQMAAATEDGAEATSDSQITAAVVSTLGNAQRQGQLKGFGVDVNTRDGKVFLSGRASSQDQRRLITELVRSTPGVYDVTEDITVMGGAAQPIATAELEPLPQPLTDSYVANPAPQQRQGTPAQMASSRGQSVPAQPAPYQMGQPVPTQQVAMAMNGGYGPMPVPMGPAPGVGSGPRYEQPYLPNYAWPGYAAYPNYAAVSYPQQYSPSAFPYIGPFYPYPQVPLGWRKVSLEWDDGWWFLDFTDK
jgi:osmotically-inducible protein OsmY